MHRSLSDICGVVTSNSEYNSFKFPTDGWEPGGFLNIEPYYKFLAFFVKTYNPKKILELGRRFGNSLYALAYFLPDSSSLDSYDIMDCGNVVQKPNVNIQVYTGNLNEIYFSSYDFIFVDVNGFGTLETKILDHIVESGFKGVVAWDDVGSQWCPDSDFWDKITIQKLKIPLHGDHFGFTHHL